MKPYCDAGSHRPIDQWACNWAWRRTKGIDGDAVNAAHVGEVSMQNWNGNYSETAPDEGNDFPRGYLLLPYGATATQVAGRWVGGVNLTTLRLAEEQAFGFFDYFRGMAGCAWPCDNSSNASRGDPALASRLVLACGDAGSGTAHGLTKVPYIRDTRRSVGLDGFVLDTALLKQRQPDRVAIVEYGTDVHRSACCQPGHAPDYIFQGDGGPMYVPFRALTNVRVANLLVSGKCLAQTFKAASTTRLHPGEWATGLAAGAAAALLVQLSNNTKEGASTADVARSHVLQLQRRIKEMAPIDWDITSAGKELEDDQLSDDTIQI